MFTNDELTAAVKAEAPHAFEFLAELVSRASLRGEESSAQEFVQLTLEKLGFSTSRIEVPDSISDDPLAGVPFASYEGRFNVLGTTPLSGGRTLLFNGHIDVVPVNEKTWSSDPFVPVIRDGWLFGRGAGDMKGGFAMALLSLLALRRLGSNVGKRDISFLSVIEEEYTGNGTLAAIRAGVSADAVILPEPTNLNILLGGIAITWTKIVIRFGGGHAESADRLASPAQAVARIIDGFSALESELNSNVPEPYSEIANPFNVNVGVINLGEWPSSVPAVAELEVRIGHPDSIDDEEILNRARLLVGKVLETAGNPKFEIDLHGFKAEGYVLADDHPLVYGVASAHEQVHGVRPESELMGSTTDARYYINQLGVPALCYGPIVKNMHGSDESVELSSIENGAATLARFMLEYFKD